MFESIFFYYPKGLRDRTSACPRDAINYINNWRDIALFREVVGASPHWDPNASPLDPKQRQTVFQAYLDDYKAKYLRPEQKYNK